MRDRYAVRMACAAVAGLGLAAAGLTGIPGAARAGAAAPAGEGPAAVTHDGARVTEDLAQRKKTA